MPLAIFDLDNTLLNGDSDHAWGEFLVQRGIVEQETYQTTNDYFYRQYQSGNLNIHEYLEFSLKPLAAHSKTRLDLWHQQFMATVITPMRLQKADELINKHRSQGDFLLIITATNAFVTRPIAHWLGVDDMLATEPEFINGAYTGRITGTPCFKEGKVTRLHEWLEKTGHSLAGSTFYSDSHNDLPLLKMVDHPVAVDPDDSLRDYAKAQHWPIISLR
jgi:HAD superfamily hydrolase (TIGR01490 family)